MKIQKIWGQIKEGFRKILRGKDSRKSISLKNDSQKKPRKRGSKKGRISPKKGGKTLPLLPQKKPVAAMIEFSAVQLSPHTQRAYQKDIRDFFSFLRLHDLLEDWNVALGPMEIAQYRDYLHQNKGLAKSSVTRKIAVLKSFYKWCKAQGWVGENPAELLRAFPQTQESKTAYLNDTEISRLLGHFGELKGLGLTQALHKVVVETLLMLGLRRSEAAAICLKHFEYTDDRWLLKVQGKGDRERRLPLPPRLLQSWSHWLQRLFEDSPPEMLYEKPLIWLDWMQRRTEQPLLISSRASSYENPLSSSEIAWIVRKTALRAGIQKKISPHVLRATAITYALDQGASHRGVQQMAGWTSPLMITRYDKRRKDPRFSAIHKLLYAQLDSPKKKGQEADADSSAKPPH